MGSFDRAPTPDPQKLDKPRRDQRDTPPPPPPSAAPPPSAPPAPERPGDAPDARETARQNRGRTRRGGGSAMTGAFDTLEEKTAQQDPKGLFALREGPAFTVVEQDRYERASARQEAKRREAREARERAVQDKAIRGREKAERDARERAARQQREREARQQRERRGTQGAHGFRPDLAGEGGDNERRRSDPARGPDGPPEGRDGTHTSQPGQRLLDLAKQHEARLRDLGQHPDQVRALNERDRAERAARQRVFDTRPLDAREAIKAVQTGDGRRDQNVTHDLLRQIMASKPYENRVPEVVDFVRAGFSALSPGNVPRDGTGKAIPTEPRPGVTLGDLMDAMGSGPLSADEAGGRRGRPGSDGPAGGRDGVAGGGGDDVLIGGGEDDLGAATPPETDPYDVEARYKNDAENIPQFFLDQATQEEVEEAIDLGIQRINRDVAERVAELGYLPRGVGHWLLDGINNGDGETGLRAAGLIHEIKDKAEDHRELLFDDWIQIADAIRERQQANPDADPDAIVSGARWSVGVRNAMAWARRGFQEAPADLAEFGEDVMSDLDAAAADYVGSRWSALADLPEDLRDDAMEATVHVTLGLVALNPNKPWTSMLDKANKLKDLQKDWQAIDPERPRSPLADPAKEFLKDAANEVTDEIEERKGSRHVRAARRAGTGVLAVADTLDSLGELYERATEDGHTHQEAARIAQTGTAMRMGSELAADMALIADSGSPGGGVLQQQHFEAIEEATAYGLYQSLQAISGEEADPLLDKAYEYVSGLPKPSR